MTQWEGCFFHPECSPFPHVEFRVTLGRVVQGLLKTECCAKRFHQSSLLPSFTTITSMPGMSQLMLSKGERLVQGHTCRILRQFCATLELQNFSRIPSWSLWQGRWVYSGQYKPPLSYTMNFLSQALHSSIPAWAPWKCGAPSQGLSTCWALVFILK